MLTASGDLWSYLGRVSCIFITTNSVTKANGDAVMGRGCALEAAQRYPSLPKLLAQHLHSKGNVPGCLLKVPRPSLAARTQVNLFNDGKPVVEPEWAMETWIASFPTKTDCKLPSSIRLITAGALHVQKYMAVGWTAVMPYPGVGNGKLRREDVIPLLTDILDDRFTLLV